MSEAYVIDAYAWIEYLDGSVRGVKVRDIVEDSGNKIYTCAVTLAEVVSKFIRKRRDPEVAFSALTSSSIIIRIDEVLSKMAGEVHAKFKRKIKDFGLADAYVLICSRRYDAKLLTGDLHFRNVDKAILI